MRRAQSRTRYRGRIAPSPTGYLHLGHARTFWVAYQRALFTSGTLVFRNEDLDQQRCRPEFVNAMFQDLRWLELQWQEGPDAGGPFAPYSQSQRREHYLKAWRKLRDGGFIYPCSCSRKDLENALQAPHQDDDELRYPGTCRGEINQATRLAFPGGTSWRFKVPDGEAVSFEDGHFGPQSFIAGEHFTDFLVWRRDDVPAYQLAVAVDDAAMQITEVVRGADLLKSTARQLLVFRALGIQPAAYFHCPLMLDENSVRLAKRHDALSLRNLREQDKSPEAIVERFATEIDWRRGLPVLRD